MQTTTNSLGDVETVIIGVGTLWRQLEPSGTLRLEREPQNRHDGNAIRVVSEDGERAGYLPRRIAFWLAPLMDGDKLRVEVEMGDARQVRHGLRPLRLRLALTEAGVSVMDAAMQPDTPKHALHKLVLSAYDSAESWHEPQYAQEVTRLLRRLSQRDLLPETEMLLALLPSRARAVERKAAEATLEVVRARLGEVRIGEAMHHHNLTLFPLFVPNGHTPAYTLLVDAIDHGQAEVTELDESGSVPELKVTNRGKMPLLIPEGEILTGAKQNRVVNTTVLVAAMSEFILPVSCVEHGRWSHVSRSFQATHYAPMGLRAMKTAQVRECRAATGRYESDQGAVWDDVACRLSEAECASPTDSLTDGYEKTRDHTQEYREALFPPEDCAGIIVATKGKAIGMDLFDCSTTLHRLWPRLSDSYFMEAARESNECVPCHDAAAEMLIDEIAANWEIVTPPLGAGTELELRQGSLTGAGVYYEGRMLHLATFTSPIEGR